MHIRYEYISLKSGYGVYKISGTDLLYILKYILSYRSLRMSMANSACTIHLGVKIHDAFIIAESG